MIYIQPLRRNDVNPNTGKQFEFGRAFFSQFNWEASTEHNIKVNYRGKQIETLVKVRGDERGGDRLAADAKEYATGGKLPLKDLLINNMHLTEKHVGVITLIFEPLDSIGEYFNLYTIPEKIPNYSDGKAITDLAKYPLQQIYYGAPGTGKSFELDRLTQGESVVRTTFHPDSDYSTFVGAYKPTMKEVPVMTTIGTQYVQVKGADGKPATETKIQYDFVAQAFLQAYIKAWKFYSENPEKPQKQYLIIEEINRGNCAQIFGDLFQLLDRNEDGFSSYDIAPDADLANYIAKQGLEVEEIFDSTGLIDISDEINTGKLLSLPNNLYIWATMNTSDQSLFPIDSAFKRRWDWKYVPIAKKNEGYKIRVKGKDENLYDYDWWDFLQKTNAAIDELTSSEDKKLGYFFCKADQGKTISADKFVSKVLFYLFGDVLKDYESDDVSFTFNETAYTLLKWKEGDKQGHFKFSEFFNEQGKGKDEIVEQFLDNIKVEKDLADTDTEDEDEEDVDNDASSDATSHGGTRDQSRYSLNGEGNYKKGPVVYEALQKYIELHPSESAAEVFEKWNGLHIDSPSNFIQTEEDYLAWKDKSKDKSNYIRAYRVVCGDGVALYISNQWSLDNISVFIEKLNAQNWDVRIDKIS